MKPHIKVIQRNGVDIFVTSSMTMKETKSGLGLKTGRYWAKVNSFINQGGSIKFAGGIGHAGDSYGLIRPESMGVWSWSAKP